MSSSTLYRNQPVSKMGTEYDPKLVRDILTNMNAELLRVRAIVGDGSSSASVDSGESYVTIGSSSGLSGERSLTGSSRISVTDNGANSTVTVDLVIPVIVASGGSGATTLTGLLQGNGTSAFTGITNSSTVGQVLRVTGASTYAWGALDLADSDAITGDLPFANLTQIVGLSVLGTATTSTADVAAITGTASQFLQVNSAGTALAFAALPSGFTGLANPTGTVGLTAVNGSLTTAMRSDGAPPLSVAITPTWTGIHTFDPSTDVAALVIKSTNQSAGSLTSNLISGQNAAGLTVFAVRNTGRLVVGVNDTTTKGILRLDLQSPSDQTVNIAQSVIGGNFTSWSIASSGAMALGDVTANGPAVVRLQINQGSGQSVDMFRVRSTAGAIDFVKVDSAGIFSLNTPLALTSGGTGQVTALAAFNALSPLTTLGDLLTNDGTNDIRLAHPAVANRALRSTATEATWAQGDIDMGANILRASTHQGSTSSGGSLTLSSTSHATKGLISFGTSGYNESSNELGIGTAPVSGWRFAVNTSAGGAPFLMVDPSRAGTNGYSYILGNSAFFYQDTNDALGYAFAIQKGRSGGPCVANDSIGDFSWYALNSASASTSVSVLRSTINTVTAGAENSSFQFFTRSAGTMAERMSIDFNGILAVGGFRVGRRAVSSAAGVTAVASDYIIAYTTLAVAATVTLQTAAAAGAGRTLIVKDETGNATGTVYIQISPSGSETIDGQTAASNGKRITTAYGSCMFHSNGSAWFTVV